MDKKLGFGLMRLPLKDLKDHKSIDMDELKEGRYLFGKGILIF